MRKKKLFKFRFYVNAGMNGTSSFTFRADTYEEAFEMFKGSSWGFRNWNGKYIKRDNK